MDNKWKRIILKAAVGGAIAGISTYVGKGDYSWGAFIGAVLAGTLAFLTYVDQNFATGAKARAKSWTRFFDNL